MGDAWFQGLKFHSRRRVYGGAERVCRVASNSWLQRLKPHSSSPPMARLKPCPSENPSCHTEAEIAGVSVARRWVRDDDRCSIDDRLKTKSAATRAKPKAPDREAGRPLQKQRQSQRHLIRILLFACAPAISCLLAAYPVQARAQMQTATEQQANADDSGAAAAVADVLSAACRGDETAFGNSFTTDNAAAYRALPAEERKRLMQRFSLSDDTGRPMLSSDQNNHTVIRCERAGSTTEFRFGAPRVHENLAFVPVTVLNGQSDDFGMVREGGKWKLLSLGLVMLDIKQLSVQWAQSDMAAREDAAAENLQTLATALDNYEQTFGKLPDSLVQLGAGPTREVTPERAALVSAPLAAGSAGGYRFLYRVTSGEDNSGTKFVLEALPEDYGTSGRASFFRDPSGKIHKADNHGASASADDPIWQPESAQ